MEISSSSLSQAGSFFTQVATRSGSAEPSSWYDADTLDVTLQMGFLPQGAPEGALSWQTMLSGRADRIHLDPVSGVVTLEGRDYAARLLDLPVTETFLNCTSSEVAQQLAQRCGLAASIDQTTTFIGQYYQIEHARLFDGAVLPLPYGLGSAVQPVAGRAVRPLGPGSHPELQGHSGGIHASPADWLSGRVSRSRIPDPERHLLERCTQPGSPERHSGCGFQLEQSPALSRPGPGEATAAAPAAAASGSCVPTFPRTLRRRWRTP